MKIDLGNPAWRTTLPPSRSVASDAPVAACATGLAQGLPVTKAVARAWAYVAEAIRRAPGLGGGAGPLDHGWPVRDAPGSR